MGATERRGSARLSGAVAVFVSVAMAVTGCSSGDDVESDATGDGAAVEKGPPASVATDERTIRYTPGGPWNGDEAWRVLNDEPTYGAQQVTFRSSAVFVQGTFTTPGGARILNPFVMNGDGEMSCEQLRVTPDALGSAWNIGSPRTTRDAGLPDGVGSATVEARHFSPGSWVMFVDADDSLVGAPVNDVRMYSDADIELAGGLANLTEPLPLLQVRCITTPDGFALTPANSSDGRGLIAGLYGGDGLALAAQLDAVTDRIGDIGDIPVDAAITVGVELLSPAEDMFWVCARTTETGLLNAQVETISSCFDRTPFM